MSRIRIISPRVEPPKDRPVQWFYTDGECRIAYQTNAMRAVQATHWCEAATLTRPSGPVHSLEAQELPNDLGMVEIRIRGRWFPGFCRHADKSWAALNPVDGSWLNVSAPDAWRPLPDDEPGDAELLEAARNWLYTWERGGLPVRTHTESVEALAGIVRARSGK